MTKTITNHRLVQKKMRQKTTVQQNETLNSQKIRNISLVLVDEKKTSSAKH